MLSDEIYEAAFDAALFDRLPDTLAAAVGARSAVLHWDDRGSRNSVTAMNRHFSADDMALYEQEFAPYDLWSQAVADIGNVNQAWRMCQLVPDEVYRQSVLFNEWSRAIGDDTFHCLGGGMDTILGQGCVGLHRGERAGDFDAEAVRVLDPLLRPLARVMSMRAVLDAERSRADTFAQYFYAQSAAALLVDGAGRLIERNRAADAVFGEGDGPLRVLKGRVSVSAARDFAPFEAALHAACRSEVPVGSTLGLVDSSGASWIAEFTPIHRIEGLSGKARALVTIRRAEEPLLTDPAIDILRTLYGLTLAEAQVAVAIAKGHSPSAVAQARSTSRETVRSQIKQIMGKLGVRRQSGIAALVASLG